MFTGLAFDIGMQFFGIPTWDDEDIFEEHTFYGLEFAPKLVFDIMAIDREKTKMAVTLTAGVAIAPDIRTLLKSRSGVGSLMIVEMEDGTTEEYYLDKMRFHMWHISPIVSIGIALGQ